MNQEKDLDADNILNKHNISNPSSLSFKTTNKDMKNEFILLQRLKEKGITMAEVARRAGMTKAGLSRMCNRTKNPNMDTLMRISEVTDIPISDMFAKADEEYFICPNCGEKINIKDNKLHFSITLTR